MLKLLRYFLYPLALLYGTAIWIRNRQFKTGAKPQIETDRPVVSIGNIKAGGTGKTPHTEYIIRLLQDHHPAIISRGYKRDTKGVVLAHSGSAASEIGDEPFQMYRKFRGLVPVAVGEERILAVSTLIQEHPDVKVLVMDDGYQHRYVARDINILLTEYKDPFYKDHLLPVGMLREPRSAAGRADMVIVTKTPAGAETLLMERKIRKYVKAGTPVFFSGIKYGETKGLDIQVEPSMKAVGVAGIADPVLFKKYLKEKYRLKKFLRFSDHHRYTSQNVSEIVDTVKSTGAEIIVTTEKDAVKLMRYRKQLKGIPVFFIPIEIFLLEKEGQFRDFLIEKVKVKMNK